MEKTTNYKLPRWEKDDFVKMDDFNDAFGKLDAALKENADAAAGAASAERVTALEQTVTKSKLCRIKYGSYTGNGKGGKANPNTLGCDFYPVLLIISTIDQYNNITRVFALRGISHFEGGVDGVRKNLITWNDHSVSWQSATETDAYYNACDVQLNTSGVTYQYLFLGFDQ